ncbi:Integral membrane protein [hydrothermal vent metagenome]|uniref:Integral membrane protein n=1 Tax=hydrothermal vent metagenome TaxID=652676 RepID=A0A3B0TAF4_9ZZZZ
MKKGIKYYFIIALKGMGMGAADVVPGVSGGTIAFITGIYEELINSIKSINGNAIKLILRGRYKDFWQAINGTFLLSLVLGIGISVVSLARLLKYLLEDHPVLIWSFFFGLIVSSAFFVGKHIKRWNGGIVISALAGVVIAYFVTVITPAEANTTYWFIFLSGAIAICAMILPGISGSFILVLLGMYKFILHSVSDFNFIVIAIFMSGALTGIIAFSNVLSWFLRKYYNQTIALLAGFMAGSLNKVWPWKKVVETFIDKHGVEKPLIEKNVLPATYEQLTGSNSMLLYAILLGITGFFIIFLFEKFSPEEPKNK